MEPGSRMVHYARAAPAFSEPRRNDVERSHTLSALARDGRGACRRCPERHRPRGRRDPGLEGRDPLLLRQERRRSARGKRQEVPIWEKKLSWNKEGKQGKPG